MMGGIQHSNGTSGSNNIAATGLTLVSTLSTGTATNPDMVFQTGVKTGSGSALATPTTALTLKVKRRMPSSPPKSASARQFRWRRWI